MTTSLQAIQIILRNVAEVFDVETTAETQASRKARNYMEEACREVAYQYDWHWLYQVRQSIFAGTWANKAFTFTGGGARKLHWVKYGSEETGYVIIPPVTIETFYTQPLVESLEARESVPQHYSFYNNVLRLNPYPNDNLTQSKVLVGYIQEFVYPLLDNSEFTIPPTFLDLCIHKACVHMARYHTHDDDEARFRQAQYESLLNLLMSKERNIQFENASFFNNELNKRHGNQASI